MDAVAPVVILNLAHYAVACPTYGADDPRIAGLAIDCLANRKLIGAFLTFHSQYSHFPSLVSIPKSGTNSILDL